MAWFFSNKRRVKNPFVWAASAHSAAERFWFGVIAVIFVAGSWAIFRAWHSASRLQAQVDAAERLIDDARGANAQLQSNLQSVSPNFVLESTARLNQNKTRAGEQVILVKRGDAQAAAAIAEPSPSLWLRWIFPKEQASPLKPGENVAGN